MCGGVQRGVSIFSSILPPTSPSPATALSNSRLSSGAWTSIAIARPAGSPPGSGISCEGVEVTGAGAGGPLSEVLESPGPLIGANDVRFARPKSVREVVPCGRRIRRPSRGTADCRARPRGGGTVGLPPGRLSRRIGRLSRLRGGARARRACHSARRRSASRRLTAHRRIRAVSGPGGRMRFSFVFGAGGGGGGAPGEGWSLRALTRDGGPDPRRRPVAGGGGGGGRMREMRTRSLRRDRGLPVDGRGPGRSDATRPQANLREDAEPISGGKCPGGFWPRDAAEFPCTQRPERPRHSDAISNAALSPARQRVQGLMPPRRLGSLRRPSPRLASVPSNRPDA